jgi:glyoxylase-like metal-dependent hydrolase (beta-lactamase superfamily II)
MTVVVNDDRLQIEQLQLGPFGTNAYILTCQETRESVLVDAPGEAGKIISHLKGTVPRYILLTHSHMDHIGAMGQLRSELKIHLAAHAADSSVFSPPPEISLKDGDTIDFGKIQIAVLHTPGHTPGSLCFKTNRYLISGDTLFPGGPGKTGTPADFAQVVKSITEKIFTLDDYTPVYPGHGESTSIKKEKEAFEIFSSRPHDPNLCGDVLWLSA